MERYIVVFCLLVLIFFPVFALDNSLLTEWKNILNDVDNKNSFSDSIAETSVRTNIDSLLEKGINPENLYLAFQGLKMINNPKDSSKIKEIKTKIISDYPKSEAAFLLASDDFYDQIYPIWENDSLKIVVLQLLLKKYPENNWRRTIFQYYSHSLSMLDNNQELAVILRDFRNEFPHDYLPFYLTASYSIDSDSLKVLEYAQTAYQNALALKYLPFYGPMQWNLEARSAPIKTGSLLVAKLIEHGQYQEAEQICYSIIKHNAPGINDEITLAQIYLKLAEIYIKTNRNNKAIEFAINALICGDSRNAFSPQAETLLKEITGLNNKKEMLEFARQRLNYNDVQFTDVTESFNLTDVKGSRIAWGDFDNDGYQDMLINGSRLFKNIQGSEFVEITSKVFQSENKANGGIWADLDNDGDLDLITKDKEQVWINCEGLLNAVNQALDNGVSTEGLGIADFNGDGLMDFYLANYEKWEDNNSKPERDQLFFGNGDGTFNEQFQENWNCGDQTGPQAGRGVSIVDFDEDGDQDIFVANYRLNQNFLWVNNGDGSFRNEARQRGCAGVEVDGWWGHTIGAEWADFDNDGDLDLITCNLAHPRYLDFSNKTMLYINSGYPDYIFNDVRASSGIRFEETNSEPAWGDFDCDGNLDLYITNVYEGRRSFLYMSNGDGTFRDVTYLSGTRHFNGWGVALSDFDNDGDLDMLVAGGEIQLFRNDTPNNGMSISIDPYREFGVNPIGKIIKIRKNGRTITRVVQGGKGTTNQHDMRLHFGVGEDY